MSYVYTMDPVPLQDKEHNHLYLFYEALRDGRLTTTSCQACNTTSWPPRLTCPACWSREITWVNLPTVGTIMSYTVQVAGVPRGFTAPLIFAIVRVGPVKFATRLVETDTARVSIGAPVELAPTAVDPPPFTTEERILPTFRLRKSIEE